MVIGTISLAVATFVLFLDVRLTHDCEDKVGPGNAYFGYEQCLEARIYG